MACRQLQLDADAALNNAFVLALLSDAAYSPRPLQSESFKQTAFRELKKFTSRATDTQGFVTRDESHVVIAFRGTKEPIDWLTDLTFGMVEADDGKVHEGFQKCIDRIWPILRQRLEWARNQDQQIWVTGHSLGGALATLAAQRLAVELEAAIMSITFGQPRVGDSAFATNFLPEHVRFINNNDIVPTLPPRNLPILPFLAFYSHVGSLKFLDEAGNLTESSEQELGVQPQLSTLLSVFSSLENELQATNLTESGLNDHRMSEYLQKLQRLAS